jgi:hypothetical protein
MPKHLVHADGLSIWAETNNRKKNAEVSLAAIQVIGTECKGNTQTKCVNRMKGKITKTLLINPLKIWHFFKYFKRH